MVRKRPIRLYRSSFAALCSLILAAVYAWNAGWLESEKGLWVLSGGVGTFYGALFTLTVSFPIWSRMKLIPSPQSFQRISGPPTLASLGEWFRTLPLSAQSCSR